VVRTAERRRLFITGGAGFVGSHVVDHQLACGHSVTVYDNLVSGRRTSLAQHQDNPRFGFVEADLLEADKLREAMAGHDLIWHLGGNTDIQFGNRVTDHDLKNCTIATANVLEAMRVLGIKEVIFSSSSTVYGDTRGKYMVEEQGPMLPICLYGAGKLACEGLFSSHAHLFGIRSWVFRFGNVLGTRMGHGVIHDFIRKLRHDPRQLEILGDGTQEKPFFTVDDCIDGMLAIYRNTQLNAETPCDVFNLGPTTTTRISKVAQIVIEEMGLSDVTLRYTGGRQGWRGDVPEVRLDVSKAKASGWEAKRSSDEAVRVAVRQLLEEQ
jgi:UDP-glucose 4-epimerase